MTRDRADPGNRIDLTLANGFGADTLGEIRSETFGDSEWGVIGVLMW